MKVRVLLFILTVGLSVLARGSVDANAMILHEPTAKDDAIDPNSLKGQIKEFGIFRISGRATPRSDETVSNKVRSSYEKVILAFECVTNVIPGKLGLHFGITFEVSGLPVFAQTNAVVTISFPEIKAPDGRRTTNTQLHSRLTANAKGIAQSWAGYEFEQPFEIVTGRWHFSVSVGRKLLEQSFTVTQSSVLTNESLADLVLRANKLAESTRRNEKKEAARLWSIAGKMGHTECQYRVAQFIEDRAALTNGVDSKCVPWYWAAATKRHVGAIRRLQKGIPVESSTNRIFSAAAGSKLTKAELAEVLNQNGSTNHRLVMLEARFGPGVVKLVGSKLRHRASFTGTLLISPNRADITIHDGMTKEQVIETFAKTIFTVYQDSPNEWSIHTTTVIFENDRVVAMEHPDTMTGLFVPFTPTFIE